MRGSIPPIRLIQNSPLEGFNNPQGAFFMQFRQPLNSPIKYFSEKLSISSIPFRKNPAFNTHYTSVKTTQRQHNLSV